MTTGPVRAAAGCMYALTCILKTAFASLFCTCIVRVLLCTCASVNMTMQMQEELGKRDRNCCWFLLGGDSLFSSNCSDLDLPQQLHQYQLQLLLHASGHSAAAPAAPACRQSQRRAGALGDGAYTRNRPKGGGETCPIILIYIWRHKVHKMLSAAPQPVRLLAIPNTRC